MPLKQENDCVINNRHEQSLTVENEESSADDGNNKATNADTDVIKDDNMTPTNVALDEKLESTINSVSLEMKENNTPEIETQPDNDKNIPHNEEDKSDGEKNKTDDEKDRPVNEEDKQDKEKDNSETSYQSEAILSTIESESKVESVEHVIETKEDSQAESIESRKEENILELNLECEDNMAVQERTNSESKTVQIQKSEREEIQASGLADEESKIIDKTEELHATVTNNEKIKENTRNIELDRKRCFEDFTETENVKLSKPSIQNRKKWGRSSVGLKSYNLIEISMDMFKNVYPDMTLSEEDDLKLDVLLHKEQQSSISEDGKKLDKNSFTEKPYTREVSDDGVDNIIAMNRKISIVDDDASKLRPPPSPAKNDKSEVLFITNLVRPFTLKQLKELLERTGRIIEDGFWTDKIKSKCYVQYESVE